MKKWNRIFPLLVSFLGVTAFLLHSVAAAPVIQRGLAKTPGEMLRMEHLRSILDQIAGQRDLLIKIHRELVRLPGTNPEDGGDGEDAKARWIEDWLATEGLPPPDRVDCPDERVPSRVRPNLILRHIVNPGAPTLWIMAYMDNSPVGDEKAWIGSPYSLRVDGDKIYGLGVQDNNNAIAASLLLLRTLKTHPGAGILNFGVLLLAGEKKGNRVGLTHVLEKRPGLFNDGDYAVSLSYGEANGGAIVVGEKGCLWLKVEIRGTQVHSSMPERGNNALAAGAELITKLPLLSQTFPQRNPLFLPPVCTFTPTKPEMPEMTINQVPGYFAFHIDSRMLSPYTPEEVKAAIGELAADVAQKYGVAITIESIMTIAPAPHADMAGPLATGLANVLRQQVGVEAKFIGIGGVTPATFLRRHGVPAVTWKMSATLDHSSNEYMSIKANLTEAEVMACLLFEL